MAFKKRKDITLGSGKLYVQEYTGTTVPETEAICTDDNILGYISGGATLSSPPFMLPRTILDLCPRRCSPPRR